MSILIIDYGMGNLGSVRRAFEECGGDVIISDDPSSLKEATRVVLPGVGAFADGMRNLKLKGWVEPLAQAVQSENIPFLGICLGMQLLCTIGDEGGETRGLDFIPGRVSHMREMGQDLRYPHVGWNEVYPTSDNYLFNDIKPGTDFYFVHSYHFKVERDEHAIGTTPYGRSFYSAINKNLIWAVQFHPEKSGRSGFQLIKNFLSV